MAYKNSSDTRSICIMYMQTNFSDIKYISHALLMNIIVVIHFYVSYVYYYVQFQAQLHEWLAGFRAIGTIANACCKQMNEKASKQKNRGLNLQNIIKVYIYIFVYQTQNYFWKMQIDVQHSMMYASCTHNECYLAHKAILSCAIDI